ncbi:hypothetical protein A2U01_0105463, partial [Trifolium medium]|nr:hypothetical protein [Trifolium medium]
MPHCISNSQLSIVPAETTSSGNKVETASSQLANIEGLGGVPKKRLRLDGEVEEVIEDSGDT